MAEEAHGVDLLCGLPGVACTAAVRACLRRLEEAMAAGDTCLDITDAGEAGQLRAELLASGLVAEEAGGLPLVLMDTLLSSRRYWRYEQTIAAALLARAADRARLAGIDAPMRADLLELFPDDPAALVDGVDWQRLAALVALAHGLAVITGGPGTGKTTVAGRVIAMAERQRARRKEALQVVIAAPTGKAAQRLRESLVTTGAGLVEQGILDQAQLARLTGHVATLHRLLHDRRLTEADLVVVDEVSMADAATLARVLERVPARAQLLLLGDPQQLASVDAGHVLSAIARHADAGVDPELAALARDCGLSAVRTTADAHPLAAAQVHLRKNWRSAASPAVSAVAAAMQEEPAAVLASLQRPDLQPAAAARAADGRPVWVERRDCDHAPAVVNAIVADCAAWTRAVVGAADARQALDLHAQRRVLCARRAGALGAAGLNERLEEALEEAGHIHRWLDGHYHGRPLLVTRNDYDLTLFNGDIGIVRSPSAAGLPSGAQAWFPDGAGGLRAVPLHRLNAVEPVFAMTIHKSQGSQFDQVDVVTATDDRGEVGHLLTRELIYTGITRAAYAARIWADADLLERALQRRHLRRTGLHRFLTAPAH